MKDFLFFIRLLNPYKFNVFTHLIFYVLTAAFTLVSIPAILPLFEVLFEDQVVVVAKPATLNGISDYLNLLKHNFTYWLSQQEKPEAIRWICVGLVLIFFLKNLFRYLAIYVMAPVRTGIVRDLRQKLFCKFIDLPMAYFSKERKGDLMARMTSDVQEVEISIVSTVEAFVKDPLLIVGSLGFMLYISVPLTLFVLVLIFFTAFVIGGISRALKRNSAVAQQLMGDILSLQEESLGGLRVIKSFCAEHYVKQKFQSIINHFRSVSSKIGRRRDLAVPLSEFLGIAVVCILLWYGANLVFSEQIASSSLIAFLYAFFNVIEPSKALSNAYFNVQKGTAALQRIQQVLDAKDQIQDVPDAVELPDIAEEICFNDVSFFYQGSSMPVLQDIDLRIPKNTKVALVGASGSGKSTMIDLLCRFYDVSSGSITIDGIDIRHIKLSALRRLIGLVTQETILFNDSIRNNILFGYEEADDEQIRQSIYAAYAHEFIDEKTDQLNHNIGDRGANLSGGQRQRLTIARALLRNPSILILDEATSALDSQSENYLKASLDELLNDKTAIIVSHRLSTIQHADLIVVLKEGRIVEMGQHDELLKLHGEYYNFAYLQGFS